jgi:dipeptidyl aminopeptidase/acylaminoacyl peptidase
MRSAAQRRRVLSAATWAVAAVGRCAMAANAAPPSVAAFAGDKSITDVAISPDGRYLSMLALTPDRRVAVVQDLTTPGPARVVMAADLNQSTDLAWCRWANGTRLVCGLREMTPALNGVIYISTRLAAVDADGKNTKLLMQNQGAAPGEVLGQFQDRVIDWEPGKPNTILVASQEVQRDARARAALQSGGATVGQSYSEFPAVYELDINTGDMTLHSHAREPIREFASDGHGQVRLGWGFFDASTQIEYYVRPSTSNEWRLLYKRDALTAGLNPVAICPERPDCAYAFGPSEGRTALWRMDLTGAMPPQIEFAHPAVDVVSAALGFDHQLLGVTYETDRPFFFVTDPTIGQILDRVKTALPDTFIGVASSTRDLRLLVLRAESDVSPATFYLFDSQKGALRRIAGAYPDLDPKTLGRMESISYPAQDGTNIPGYLTVPPGARAANLPLVVMPHGGPTARDHWGFDFLRAFLVSRGYAVLQMNFRGSAGYGTRWRDASLQDWGGLPYSDVTDGAHWAIKQGIADPKRLCIVGWSYGGYVALLSAVRNADLYRCSVSIAGVSDLGLLESQQSKFANSAISRAEIGIRRAKLEQDSPRGHAGDIAMPVLMMHGDKDAQVNVEESRAMDAALTTAHKPHEFILIKGADHQMTRESDRTTILTAIEGFLARNLAAGGS